MSIQSPSFNVVQKMIPFTFSIIFSSIDMLDNTLLHLALLHSAGCTHKDLKRVFPTVDIFDPMNLWETLLA